MKKTILQKRSEAGSTLIEMLFAFALLGVGSAAFLQSSKIISATRNSAELVREKTMIRNMLMVSTACEKIKGCVKDELRELNDSEGRTLVNDKGTTTYGRWRVEARCQDDKSLEVRVGSFFDGKPKLDPITRKPLDFKSPSSVVFQPGALCGRIEAPPASNIVTTLHGEFCKRAKGTCDPPARYPLGGKMCCDDGSNMPKPLCPSNQRAINSYWDRQGSWGLEGHWVVLCQ